MNYGRYENALILNLFEYILVLNAYNIFYAFTLKIYIVDDVTNNNLSLFIDLICNIGYYVDFDFYIILLFDNILYILNLNFIDLNYVVLSNM